MKILIPIIFLSLCLLSPPVWGQNYSVERYAIGSTGQTFSSGSLNGSYIIGDVAIQTFRSGTLALTQGFTQPLNTGLEERFDFEVSYEVYPNPTQDFLNLVFRSERPITLQAMLYDLTGRRTGIRSETMQLRPEARARLDMTGLAEGVYALSLVDEDGAVRGSLLVEKR